MGFFTEEPYELVAGRNITITTDHARRTHTIDGEPCACKPQPEHGMSGYMEAKIMRGLKHCGTSDLQAMLAVVEEAQNRNGASIKEIRK